MAKQAAQSSEEKHSNNISPEEKIKPKLIFVPQGGYGELIPSEMEEFKGMYTYGMDTCCHVIVKNKVTGHSILCHADTYTNLKDQRFGLSEWIKKVCSNESYQNLEVNLGTTDSTSLYYTAVIEVLTQITNKTEEKLKEEKIFIAQEGDGINTEDFYGIGILNDGEIIPVDYTGDNFMNIKKNNIFDIYLEDMYETPNRFLFTGNRESRIDKHNPMPPYPINNKNVVFDLEQIACIMLKDIVFIQVDYESVKNLYRSEDQIITTSMASSSSSSVSRSEAVPASNGSMAIASLSEMDEKAAVSTATSATSSSSSVGSNDLIELSDSDDNHSSIHITEATHSTGRSSSSTVSISSSVQAHSTSSSPDPYADAGFDSDNGDSSPTIAAEAPVLVGASSSTFSTPSNIPLSVQTSVQPIIQSLSSGASTSSAIAHDGAIVPPINNLSSKKPLQKD
jgi:hypothetical protein